MTDPATLGEAGDVDVDAVAAAVSGCASVSHLVGGSAGDQIATFLPGRRVAGVRVSPDEVEVHIASRWDVPVPDVAAEVRAAVAPLVGGRSIAVAVDDIGDPVAALPAAGETVGRTVVDGGTGALDRRGGPIAMPSPS